MAVSGHADYARHLLVHWKEETHKSESLLLFCASLLSNAQADGGRSPCVHRQPLLFTNLSRLIQTPILSMDIQTDR
ncbi:hypothetical protein DdX_17407 [Ditylenchus destructor]|uniref:Uncharacterized protein n=1 Tax=Ditylenchus destructor TaxID=166010 RepID=A0AAD4MME5_9BILA|nr:hypothetical protein DdX_17407 [Ditylenchus destructor]